MELKDVKTILKRIEVNYPNKFENDAYTQNEWYKELKNYDYEDVVEKLEQHFRTEQYQPPKVYFLTKNLIKTADKNKQEEYVINCPLCGRVLKPEEYDAHYDRCLSVQYVLRQYRRFNIPNPPTKKVLYQMEQYEFDERYKRLLMYVQKFSTNEDEKWVIDKILNGDKKDE